MNSKFARLAMMQLLLLMLIVACGVETPTAAEIPTTATEGEPTAVVEGLELTTLDGQTLNLADYRDQVVLVNFWATWCTPCRIEMPILDAYYRAHQDEGFVLLAVNNSENSGRVAEFIAETDFAFPIILDEEGQIADYFGGIRAMPTSFLLDRQGEVQQQFFGVIDEEKLDTAVTPLLDRN